MQGGCVDVCICIAGTRQYPEMVGCSGWSYIYCALSLMRLKSSDLYCLYLIQLPFSSGAIPNHSALLLVDI